MKEKTLKSEVLYHWYLFISLINLKSETSVKKEGRVYSDIFKASLEILSARTLEENFIKI